MYDHVTDEKLLRQVKRADRVIVYCMIGILFLVIVLFSLILIQNQINAEISRNLATQNHKRTQEHVKCVGEALVKPLAARKESDLDACTKTADNNTKEAR